MCRDLSSRPPAWNDRDQRILLTLLDHMRKEKFIRPELEFKLDVVERVEDVLAAFDYRLLSTRGKVPVEPIRKTL